MSYINYQYGIEEGKVMYFKTKRFYPNNIYLSRMKYLKNINEIVSFDCGLFNLDGILENNINEVDSNFQFIAVVINPIKEIDYTVDSRFTFCGYDLCEECSCISAITNCDCQYNKAINYSRINKYGLIDKYEEAIKTQKLLKILYPDEDHADCQIVKIWRFIK